MLWGFWATLLGKKLKKVADSQWVNFSLLLSLFKFDIFLYMDSNPETNANQPPPPPKKNLSQVEQELSQEIDSQVQEVNGTEASEQKKIDNLEVLGKTLRLKAIEQLEELRQTEEQAKNKLDRNKIIEAKQTIVSTDLRKLTIAARKGITVNNNPKTQAFIEKLAEKALSDNELVDIFQTLEEYLLGTKEIVLSTSPNEQEMSEFERDVFQIELTNPEAAIKIINSLVDNASLFGKEKNEIRKRFGRLVTMLNESQGNARIDQIIQEYFPNFPKEQKKFISILHKPDLFLELINNEIKSKAINTTQIENEIKDIYSKKNGNNPSPEMLRNFVNREIRIEVAEKISKDIINVLNQLYRQLSIDRAHKPFNEVENEDPFHGITATKNMVVRALQGLESTFIEMEDQNPDDPRLVKLPKLAEEDYFTAEINYKGSSRPTPRLKPLPYYKEVKLSEFILNQMTNFGHWREKTGYFHDVGYVYSQPPHEGVFFEQLGQFAERMSGNTLDSIMNLPDGEISIKALHLYDKFLEEEMAKIDHRLRANMFSTEFEGINTKIEEKVKEYLRLEFGREESEISITSAVNNAVGMANGVFLTGPEKLSYSDPVTATGKGAIMSYGTVDAPSANALSGGLHTILRWQGPAHLRSVLFLEADGHKFNFWKSLIGKGYDFHIAQKNAEDYMQSFYDLKSGREGSKRNLVIDKLLNITKTASIGQREGWREFYQLESHFTYDEKGNLKLLDSFKSMDVIGFQAINWFLRNIDSGVDLSEKTYLEKIIGPEADQRETLFKHIHKNYFKPFSDQSYEDYIKDLRVRAEIEVKKGVIENKTLPFDDYEQAVQRQISELFVKGAISRVIAARFPTKLLRMDKDRYHSNGKGRWRQIYESMKTNKDYKDMNRDQFCKIMNDIEFAEELVRSDTSQKVKKSIHMLPLDENDSGRSIGDHADLLYNLDRKTLESLLRSKGVSEERIKKSTYLYDLILNKITGKSESKYDEKGKLIKTNLDFLDGEAVDAIKDYPFSLGVENTDMSLIAYRGTGPRMVARCVKDIGSMEKTVVNGFIRLPKMFTEIAANGDYSPLIKYLEACQAVFLDVQGVGPDYEFNYAIAGMLKNYMRKNESAQALFGLGGIGKINSLAGLIAGDSNLVREWDTRDLDKFDLALQQKGLLPKSNFDTTYEPKYEQIWKIDKNTDLPVKTNMTKKQEKYKWSIKRLRERFGSDWKAGSSKTLSDVLPIALIWLAWQYIKKTFEDAFGTKKG